MFRLECRTQGMRQARQGQEDTSMFRICGRQSELGGGKAVFCMWKSTIESRLRRAERTTTTKRYLCFIICGDSALSPSFRFLSPLLSSRVEDEWHLMIPIVIIYNLIGALDMLTFFLLCCLVVVLFITHRNSHHFPAPPAPQVWWTTREFICEF